MDDSTKSGPDEHVAAIENRLEVHRESVSETLEALAYKTDVRARGSEALADGIEIAKNATAQATENAAVQAIDLTARASEAVTSGLTVAKQSTSDALDLVRSTADDVEPETRTRLLYGVAGAAALFLVVRFLRRNRNKNGDG